MTGPLPAARGARALGPLCLGPDRHQGTGLPRAEDPCRQSYRQRVADPSLTQLYLSTNSTLDPSDILIGSREMPALAAGTSSSGSTTVTIPQGTASGTWYIIAKADAGGVVIEISESNNTYGRSIKIGTY